MYVVFAVLVVVVLAVMWRRRVLSAHVLVGVLALMVVAAGVAVALYMKNVLIALAAVVLALIYVQVLQWRQYVLLVYILPFGALALTVTAAGAVIALYMEDPFILLWIIAAAVQTVYTFVLGVVSLLSD